MAQWLAALALAAALPAQGDFMANSYKGKAPPELASEGKLWFNSAGPLTLAGLKGKVVWLEFSFIN
jgi:hypothetical protein